MLSQPDGDRHRGEGAETDVPSIEALLIPYARLSGYENMAVDEYLIRLHESAGAPLFRVYGWGTPAISLGRYQKPDCLDLEACARDGVEVVRRITGGGAIFHDDEVTYSFVCSDEFAGLRNLPVARSYEKLNGFVIDLYRGYGLTAHFAKDAATRSMPDTSAPFCFSGRQEYDIFVNGMKIGGNAQRRAKGVVFQHGSIPLTIRIDSVRRYFSFPVEPGKFTSLSLALGREADVHEVVRRLEDSFKAMLGVELTAFDGDPLNDAALRRILEHKYRCDSWNLEARTVHDEIAAC
jgi:lipoate-protein ligase A